MCRYGLQWAIVSENGTQFASTMVIDFSKDLGVQIKFVSVVHPQANDQAESANKIILKGLKKKIDEAKGLWAELLPKILLSYHTILCSTTKETMFIVVYKADAMLPVEIDMPLWRRS